MKLPHGWLLRHGFNLCCEVHSCHLMRCEIPCQSTFYLAALHIWGCKSIMCNVRIDCSSGAKPHAQAHFLTYVKMHETKLKLKKKSLFLSLPECTFPLFAVSAAFAVFMKFSHVTNPVNTVEWLHVSDPWWHKVAFCLLDVSCLLLDPYKDVCLYHGD